MTIDSCGQAFRQSLHFVQRSRKVASPAAPGGRSQSVRKAGAGFSGTASAWEENSFAAFATEMTESLKKSRRPYLGSVATGAVLLFHRFSSIHHPKRNDAPDLFPIRFYMTPSARSL